jgi:hypothetical protein
MGGSLTVFFFPPKIYLKFKINFFFWESWLCIRNGSLIFKNRSYDSEEYYPDICQSLLFFVSDKFATSCSVCGHAPEIVDEVQESSLYGLIGRLLWLIKMHIFEGKK